MSRKLIRQNNEIRETLDDIKKCRWLYDGICCNGMSDALADCPSEEYCSKCVLFTKERRNGKRKTQN